MLRVFSCMIILFCFTNAKDMTLTLDQAVKLALKNNSLNKISKLNLEIAKAQYKQALSANYPTLDSVLYFNRDDKDTIFEQRGVFQLSDTFKALLSGTGVTTTPADIDVIAKGRDTVRGQLEVNYPLYTGGKISAIIEQARLNKHIQKQTIIRRENSIIYDVKKYFYAYVLTDQLYNLINESYDEIKLARDLTKEFLYDSDSDLKVNQSDYLNIKLLTSITKSTLSKIQLNKKMLENAMSNLVGLSYKDSVKIKYKEKEIMNQNLSLQKLVKKAYELNPDINSINLAIKIKNEQIKEANSNNYPMVNVFGNLSRTYNSYEYGYLSDDDKNRWNIGVAIKLSLFDGFKTRNKVIEKKISKKITKERKELLENAVALQLKNEFLKSSYGFKEIKFLKEAVNTATKNTEINLKAYRYKMAKVSNLMQAKIMELYIKADYYKQVHNYLVSLATIDKLVGTKIEELDF